VHLYGNGVHHLAIAVPASADATAVAELIETAVDGDDEFPVTLNNTAGALTFTAKFGGTPGNWIDLRWNQGGATAGESTPAGLTLPSIVAGAAGATGWAVTGAARPVEPAARPPEA
jgi:phage tail sheath gpL-like